MSSIRGLWVQPLMRSARTQPSTSLSWAAGGVIAGACLLVILWLTREAEPDHGAADSALISPVGALEGERLHPVEGVFEARDDPSSEPSEELSALPAAVRGVASPTSEAAYAPSPGLVRVSSDDGSLIVGASVRSVSDGVVTHAVTDGRGDATVPRPVAGERWDVTASAAGHFHVRASQAGRDGLWLQLPRACSLEGVTRDESTHAPLAGVLVTLHHDCCEGCVPDIVQCDSEGRFRLVSIPIGVAVTLHARRAGYVQLTTRIQVLEHEVGTLCVLSMQRATRLEIAVTDVMTSAPVASAVVLPSGARTSADGAAVVEGTPESDSEMKLEVRAPGYLTTSGRVAVDGAGRPTVPLLAGARIRGTLRRVDGTPLSGATVTAVEDGRAVEGQVVDPAARARELPAPFVAAVDPAALTAVTDDEGRFELAGLWPRWRYKLIVRREGIVPFIRSDIATNEPGAASIVGLVVLEQERGAWRGRVISNGEPVEAELEWNAASTNGRARTDTSGSFFLEGLPATRVYLSAVAVRRDRDERRRRGSHDLVIPIDGTVTSDILLMDLDDTVMMTTSGQVVALDGSGLGGVRIEASAYLDSVVTYTDERGSFSFVARVMPSHLMRIHAQRHGYRAFARVAPGSSRTTLELPRCVQAEVVVRGAESGAPLDRWQLTVNAVWTESRKKFEAQVFTASGDPASDPPRSLGGGYVVHVPEGDTGVQLSLPRAALSLYRAIDVRTKSKPRIEFRVPELDLVELSITSDEQPTRSTHVRLVPTDLGGDLLTRVAQGEGPESIQLPTSLRDGTRMFESLHPIPLGEAHRMTIGLRRGVDYRLVLDDPRDSIDPPVLAASGRVSGAASAHVAQSRE